MTQGAVSHIRLLVTLLAAAGLCLGAAGAMSPAKASLLDATPVEDESEKDAPPPPLKHLQEIKPESDWEKDDKSLPFDIRKEALKEAALSYGARGGLATRTYEIRRELEVRSSYLDKVYNFRELLVAAPSNMLIEPPIVSESLDAFLVEGDGQTAAVSDVVYNINKNVRIVSAPRNWRQYLERQWGEVKDPPDILRPKTEDERKVWRELVKKGWEEGIGQADAIFEEDLNRLTADFNGMVRYRRLLAQGMVSPPYALQVDRGVTGGGDEMRVGDRAVKITGRPQLLTGSSEWQPASR